MVLYNFRQCINIEKKNHLIIYILKSFIIYFGYHLEKYFIILVMWFKIILFLWIKERLFTIEQKKLISKGFAGKNLGIFFSKTLVFFFIFYFTHIKYSYVTYPIRKKLVSYYILLLYISPMDLLTILYKKKDL